MYVQRHTWDAFVSPLSQWKKSDKYCILWVCVCNLSYPACKAHAPYCHLWLIQLYNIFPLFLIKGTIFERKLLNKKCVFIYSITLSEKFFILRRTELNMIINMYRSLCKIPVILVRFLCKFNFLSRFSINVQVLLLLVSDQLDALFLHVFISCLYMFRATSAHHQEGQIVLIHHLV
jgi:hypothetical protein